MVRDAQSQTDLRVHHRVFDDRIDRADHFDEQIGVKPLMHNLAMALHAPILEDVNPFGIGALSLPNVIVPIS